MFLIVGLLILVLMLISALIIQQLRRSTPEELLRFLSGERGARRQANHKIEQLTDQVEQIFEEKNIMLTALSHDIKTPLTEALLQLEMMEDDERAIIVKDKLLMINNIIRTSLDYSREPESITKVNTDVTSMLESIADNYIRFGFNVSLDSPESAHEWPIEIYLFRRLVRNILDNAKKYADHCQIRIEQLKNGNLQIRFTDNGEGVPEKQIEKLATPYFRVDQSRSRDTGGTGLGLAIVRKIAQLHNGEVKFQNAKPNGFEVIVTLHPALDHNPQ